MRINAQRTGFKLTFQTEDADAHGQAADVTEPRITEVLQSCASRIRQMLDEGAKTKKQNKFRIAEDGDEG